MAAAIELADRGRGHTRPNPPVGAIIVRDGEIIGRGWHRKCGGEHAEVAAIADALKTLGGGSSAGLLRDSTLYVTLEPCSKPGRVGACTDAIVAAGIGKVVWAVPDPNPKNCGRAKRILRSSLVECECWATDRRRGEESRWHRHLAESAAKLVAPFAKHVKTGLPYVSVKLAMSLDGRICDSRGESRWVSSAVARKTTGAFRAAVDAVMVGAETVRQDDPSLLSHGRRNDDLWRVVISASGDLPPHAQVFTDAARARTLVYRDVTEALRDLGRRGFLHVLCEGGLKLATSLAEAGLVDEWVTVLAPKVIGTRPIGKAVTFDTLRPSVIGNGLDEIIGHFGRGAAGALS